MRPDWRRWAPRLRAEAIAAWRDPWVAVLAAMLAIGLLLRVYLTVRWRPALVNYSDTGIYIQDAYAGGFADPLRVVGYGLFLIPLHWITPHMLFVVLLQHAMGLATAVLLYLGVRRCGAPQIVALVPALGIALGGTQIFLEHSILTEALFTLLVALALYAAVRTSRGSLRWALLVGVCIGLTVTIRGVGTILVAVLPLWLLFASGRPTRLTAIRGGAALAVSLAIVGGYVAWRHAEAGSSGLTTNSNWNFYGRVAPFADCTRFTPPRGTEPLCDPVPPSRRQGRNSEWYIYDTDSPAQKAFGPPYLVSPDPDANKKLGKFSIAAVKAQSGDYLSAVWRDLTRIVAPNRSSDGDLSYDEFMAFLIDGPNRDGTNEFVESWRRLYYPRDTYHRGDIDPLETYERRTRIQGPLMVVVLLLAAVAPWLAPRPARRGAALVAVTALALLLYPIATHAFDARFVVPALGPLLAAAALGAWGLAGRLGRLRA
jgi:dolichyl-phosphate-mannose-protein mannosyltransferase